MNLYYIYHSAFVVEGEENILIFDYYKIPKGKQEEKKNFVARFLEQKEKAIFVFSTHSHSDHFNPEILSWTKWNENITYILSDDIPKDNTEGKCIHWVKEGERLKLEDLEIAVYGSTDLGVSFVVEMEGKNIFHAGDLHLWHWEGDSPEEEKTMKDHYLRVLKEIADDEHAPMDYAFSPVDSRLGIHTFEALDFLFEHLEILYFVPMHIQDDYSVFSSLKKYLSEKRCEVETIFYEDAMQDLGTAYYMLEEVEGEYFIELVNARGEKLPKRYLERDSIYAYLSKQGEDAFFFRLGSRGDRKSTGRKKRSLRVFSKKFLFYR